MAAPSSDKHSIALPPLVYVLALTQFALPFMYSGVGVTLPSLGLELGTSGVGLGLIETVYLAAGAAFLLPLGCVAQRADKRTLFSVGLLVYACATLAIGWLPSTGSIIAVRVVQGIASAFMGATVMAILFEATPAGVRGRAVGICMGAVYCGLAAGPLVAGFITTQLGWRWVFIITSVPLFAAFLVVEWAYKGRWRFSKPELNWASTALVIAAVLLLVSGSSILGEQALGYLFLGAGLVACVAFFALEERSEEPMMRLSAVRANRDYSRGLISQFLVYAAGFAMTFLFSIFLQLVSGYTAQEAGLLLVVSPLCMALMAPLSGHLADRYRAKSVAGFGALLVMVSLLLATRISAGTPVEYLILVLIAQGVGLGMFSAPNVSRIMHSVEGNQVSIASALSAKARSLGMLASMTVVMIQLSIHMGPGPISEPGSDFVHDMLFGYLNVVESSFTVQAGLAFIAMLLVAGTGWLRRLRNTRGGEGAS